jgi:hypothetical protein
LVTHNQQLATHNPAYLKPEDNFQSTTGDPRPALFFPPQADCPFSLSSGKDKQGKKIKQILSKQ